MEAPNERLTQIHARLQSLGEPERVEILQRFFKTGPGEYGEGDRFLGVRVPAVRTLVPAYSDLSLGDILALLHSPIHEARLLALLILVHRFNRNDHERQAIYRAYLRHTRFINNWDLVDASAEHIVGGYLRNRSRRPLFTLAHSHVLWERRIAIMATFHFIKNGEFDETLRLADTLLTDPEDLIHKAVGWMLREIGRRDRDTLRGFLLARYQKMPRTMLRYAIERMSDSERKAYLTGRI